MSRFANHYYKIYELKVGCFVDFFHHHVMTMSAYTYACMPIAILCLKVEQKQVCEQSLYNYREKIRIELPYSAKFWRKLWRIILCLTC